MDGQGAQIITPNASPSGWFFRALSRWISEPWIAAWYARERQANGLCPKAFHAGAFCAGCWKCLKSSNLALAFMIQSLLDIAGSPDLASFMAVVIAYVWCPQGVPRRIRAAKKRKKPSETGLGWFTTFRRKEAPAGFEPALADLQSPRIFVVSRLGACFLPSRLLHCGSPFLGRLLGFLFVLFF